MNLYIINNNFDIPYVTWSDILLLCNSGWRQHWSDRQRRTKYWSQVSVKWRFKSDRNFDCWHKAGQRYSNHGQWGCKSCCTTLPLTKSKSKWKTKNICNWKQLKPNLGGEVNLHRCQPGGTVSRESPGSELVEPGEDQPFFHRWSASWTSSWLWDQTLWLDGLHWRGVEPLGGDVGLSRRVGGAMALPQTHYEP